MKLHLPQVQRKPPVAKSCNDETGSQLIMLNDDAGWQAIVNINIFGEYFLQKKNIGGGGTWQVTKALEKSGPHILGLTCRGDPHCHVIVATRPNILKMSFLSFRQMPNIMNPIHVNWLITHFLG